MYKIEADAPPPRRIEALLFTDARVKFVSDRWGEVNECFRVRSRRAPTLERVSEILVWLVGQGVFASEITFLVWSRSWADCDLAAGSPDLGLRIMLEFETNDDYSPNKLHDQPDPQTRPWVNYCSVFAPALEHVGDALNNDPDPNLCGHEPFISDAGFYGAAYGVILPLKALDRCNDVANLLLRNALPFPPTAHMRASAMRRMRWIRGDGVKAANVPKSAP